MIGIKIAPSKSILVPTAHDEHAIRLEMYRDVFAAPAGIAWNTDAERRFVSSRFQLRALVEETIGCGVDLPEGDALAEPDEPPVDTGMGREPFPPHIEGQANAFRRRHRMHDPFLLYGGRIDPGKGCEELLEYFQTYVKEGGTSNLMLMGTKPMPLPEDPHVRFAGVLPDAERFHALEAATVVGAVAARELVAARARGDGRRHSCPGHAQSEVPVDHCRKSNAAVLRRSLGVHRSPAALMKDSALRAAKENGCAWRRTTGGARFCGIYDTLFSALADPSRESAGS